MKRKSLIITVTMMLIAALLPVSAFASDTVYPGNTDDTVLYGGEYDDTLESSESDDIFVMPLVNYMFYTGKALKPKVKVYYYKDETTWEEGVFTEGVDYTLSYSNNVNPGFCTINVTGISDRLSGTSTVYFLIYKASNPVKAKGSTKTIKYKKVKSKAQYIKKAVTVTKAVGKVTYSKVSGSKKITISKAGKIKVAKGTKKGSYKIKVAVNAAGNIGYEPGTKNVKVIVKVK